MTQQDFKKILEDSLRPIREEQAELRDLIETRVLPPLTYIETTLKSYADR